MDFERPIQTGDLIANTYRLEHVLGQGSTGVVFAARDRGSNARVAIKILRRDLARHRSVVDAFRAYARTAAAVRCSEICRVYELAETQHGVPCLVMEHLEGWDLGSELEARRRYGCAEAVGYVQQACAGLEKALRGGVVHADLKPSKLFVAAAARGEQRLKLLDVGGSVRLAASSLLAASRELDDPQAALWSGEIAYAAPEQLDARDLADARTNVWALGAILYSLLAGRPPFDEPTTQRLIAAIRANHVPPLSSLGADVPDGLQRVLERALSKSRAERFASVTPFAQALAPYASAESMSA
jgi:eukaryotic-like serine/threonine-protein kinase